MQHRYLHRLRQRAFSALERCEFTVLPKGKVPAIRPLTLVVALTLAGCLDTQNGSVSGTNIQQRVASELKGQSNGSSGNVPSTGALINPVAPASDCTPDFQTVGREHSLWPQTDFGLPTVVGQSKTWNNPGGGSHRIKVTKAVDSASAATMGATNQLHRLPEYSQHDAFSADGTYMLSHGIVNRALFDGRNYQNIRVVQNNGAVLGDWQWHPTIDRYAFYFDGDFDRVYRYDADANTHTLLFDFQNTPVTVDGQQFRNMGTSDNAYAMGAQGSITADGSRVSVIMSGNGNGAVVVLNLDTQTVVDSLLFAGKDHSSELDVSSISPDGQYMLVTGKFDDMYSTSFGNRYQLYAYDINNLNHSSRRLVSVPHGHMDVGIDANGDSVVVMIGHEPSGGWVGRTSMPGLSFGVYSFNLNNSVHTRVLGSELWANSGGPAGHISMPLDGSGIAVISTFQGGHNDSVSFAQNNAIIAVELDTGRVAWLGWDEGENNGLEPAGSTSGYYAQPHTSFVQSVQYADGSRGWKMAWASDNRSVGTDANYYVGEVICD